MVLHAKTFEEWKKVRAHAKARSALEKEALEKMEDTAKTPRKKKEIKRRRTILRYHGRILSQ